jgi:Tol biopolymer transport system component
VAYSVRSASQASLWLIDLARAVRTRVTMTLHDDFPVWSPDGRKLVYSSNRSSVGDIYVRDLTTGSDELLVASDNEKWPTSWSSDGRTIFYSERTGSSAADIHYVTLDDRKTHTFLNAQYGETMAQLSPDGKWLAYQSNESGDWAVFIAPFPPTGRKFQVSAGSGVLPKWRADGKELFFVDYPPSRIYAVPVALGATPQIGQPVSLFDIHFVSPGRTAAAYDVTPDGERFLINSRLGDDSSPAPITVVQNFDLVLREAEEKHD